MKREFSPFSTQRIDPKTGRAIETVHIDIAADMRIGRDLQKQLRTSVSTWAWYAQLKEHAHAKLEQLKERLENTAAKVYAEIREENPRMTETNVKNRIRLDDRVKKRRNAVRKWSARHRMLHELCVQLKERNDNLRTLESSERKERDASY